MTEQMKRWAKWVGYPTFYLLSFALFLSLVFPYDKLKERIVTSFNAQQKAAGAQQELHIDTMGWYWFTGVRAKGIRLVSAPQEPGKPPAEIHIDEARIKMGLFASLVGKRDVTFHLDALGGTIDGEYQESKDERDVDVTLDGVHLDQVDALSQAIGLPVQGTIAGTIKLQMPEGKASKGNGTIDLEGTDVAIGDGKAKLKGALEMPKLVVGALTFNAEAKDGVLKITKFSAGGKDLELNGEGKVQMRELANESSLDVNLKFKINDAFRGKSEITKNLFGAPGSPKGGDIELFVPEMKRAKRPDGFYSFQVRGLLGHLQFQPMPNFVEPGGGGAAGAAGRPPRMGATPRFP